MKKFQINDLLEYRFLSDVRFSPSGKHLCFTVHQPNLEQNEYDSNLWIYSFEQDEFYQLTNSGKDQGFIWLNDEAILFTSGREMGVPKEGKEEEKKDKKEKKEETKLFKINIKGGEAKHVDTLKKKVSDMQRTGSTVIMTIREDITKENDKEKSSNKDEYELEEGKDYHELDEIPFWQNGEGFSNKVRTHLYAYHLDEKQLDKLVGGIKTVEHFDVKDNEICLNVSEYTDKKEITNYVYFFNLETKELKQLTEKDFAIGRVMFLGNNILFEATDKEPIGLSSNKELYLYERARDTYTKKTNMDKSIGNAVLTDIRYGKGKNAIVEDETYYFTTTEDYNVSLNKYSPDQGVERIIEKNGTIDFFDVNDEKIAYVALQNDKAQELYLFNGNDETCLSSFNTFEKSISTPQPFQVTSNGKTIDAWIMKPTEFEVNKQYPTILEIHGGPNASYGDIHFNEFQLLASNGYCVVFCNPLGSAGKGNDFADIIGKYGKNDYEDIMNVLQAAIERYDFIDETRLGVAGGSYGGYMTNYIIGHTDRFKAAVSYRSISNWISMFGITDIGYYFVKDQLTVDPWEDFEKLWEHSPMKYADQVSTPTLFIQSREDYRCWEPEAIQMFTSLKYHDVESKLLLFEGENHNLSRTGHPKQRMKRLEETLLWFNKHLK